MSQPFQVAIAVQGPPGPPGTSGGSTYVHTQASPATPWVINHNLGFNPSVFLTNPAGVQFLADIQNTSINQVVVTPVTALAGFARLT